MFGVLTLDFVHAVRALVRDRGFAVTAVLMLTLALTLNVAAFTLLQTMVFRGYPLVERNDRLVYIQERGARGCCVSYADFVEWREHAVSFSGMAYAAGERLTTRDENGGRQRLSASIVSTNTFDVLGVEPVLGRSFTAADSAGATGPVAILSHAFWQRRFGGRSDAIGQTLKTDELAPTVIGVMPEGFSFPEYQDLWIPVPATQSAVDRKPSGFLVVARLADGTTIEGARAEISAISQRLSEAYPDTNRGVTPEARHHAEFFFGDARLLFGSMWAATWFVLLICCANLANLCVARTLRRSHELSTRLALGAGYERLSRQTFIENLLLAAFAAAGAWWLAKRGMATYASATASVHYVLDFSLGREVLLYLTAIALGAGVLIAFVPIATLRTIDLTAALKVGGSGTNAAFTGKQAALIVAQVTFAVILLSGAGVLVRSFMKFTDAPIGIDPKNVLAAAIELPAERYASADALGAALRTVKERLETLPGVKVAGTSSHRPLAGALTRAFEIEGADGTATPRNVGVLLTGVGYFNALGTGIGIGRDFAESDDVDGVPAAIVNRQFAEVHWPGEDAIGKRLRLSGPDGREQWRTVVGVAPNIMQTDPTRQSYAPLVYVPLRQVPTRFLWVLARASAMSSDTAVAVRSTLARVDPDLLIEQLAPLEDLLAFNPELMTVETQHLGRNAVLFPIFAISALVLAAGGLFAVVVQSVGRRTREIGVRIAIGAKPDHLRRWVLAQGMAPVVLGLVVGLPASLAVNRLLQSQLIGVAFYDTWAMVAGPFVFAVVGLAACWVPARRAMSVDPVVALRSG